MNTMSTSIVVPISNEASNLEALVDEFVASLADARGEIQEIILVENGSRDQTVAVGQRLAARYAGWVRLVVLDRASYGEAVKRGIAEARAPWIAVLECDFLDADFVRRARAQLAAQRSPFAVASKRHADSVDRRPLKRRLITAAFNRLLSLFCDFPGTDTHGLKVVRTDVARYLANLCQTSDEIFQTEFVMLGYRLRYKVVEVPVDIAERRPTPFPILKRIPKVVRLLHQIRKSLDRFYEPESFARALAAAPPGDVPP
ncbi:MAG: glycosyltransferase [Lentisphaerae bacterium]|nr:glycosyltransferase [Lentisphaerota bacterium]